MYHNKKIFRKQPTGCKLRVITRLVSYPVSTKYAQGRKQPSVAWCKLQEKQRVIDIGFLETRCFVSHASRVYLTFTDRTVTPRTRMSISNGKSIYSAEQSIEYR